MNWQSRSLNIKRVTGVGNTRAPQAAYSTNWLTIPPCPGKTGRMSHRLDATFAALADPTRRAILTMLLEDDMAVTDVAEPFAMSLAAISKHLTVLAEAGLISQEKRGRVKWVHIHLKPSEVKLNFLSQGYLQPPFSCVILVRRFWRFNR